MRGHDAVAATTLRSEDRIGAKTHSRLHRDDGYGRVRSYRYHSVVIYNTDIRSAIVYQTGYPLMGCVRSSTAGGLLVVQSER